MKNTNFKVGTLTLILVWTCALISAAQSHTIESDDKIIYRKDVNSPAFLTIDTENGFVGVNTPAPTQEFEVNGKVLIRDREEFLAIGSQHAYNLWVTDGVVAEDLFIVESRNWADYVFRKDYHLKELQEVRSFIDAHGHLPGVPSAKEVREQGYSQHDINRVLLEKVEELTLYTIDQENNMLRQSKVIDQQQKLIRQLMDTITKVQSENHQP